MAQHGYLGGDYGAGFDPRHGDDDHDRRWRGGRERGWRGDRDRSFMLEDRGGRGERGWNRDDDNRSFFSLIGDEARSWFGDEDDGRRSSRGRGRSDAAEWFGGRGGYEPGRRGVSSNPDDHYLSWRQRQLEALDRDYEEYCREREQRFHEDFESWRRRRQESGSSSSGSDELILDRKTEESAVGAQEQMAGTSSGTEGGGRP